MPRRLLALLSLLALFWVTPAFAAQPPDVQTAWQLLDYMAVDYGAAVQRGRVINEVEYAEMVEFSSTVRVGIVALPPTSASTSRG